VLFLFLISVPELAALRVERAYIPPVSFFYLGVVVSHVWIRVYFPSETKKIYPFLWDSVIAYIDHGLNVTSFVYVHWKFKKLILVMLRWVVLNVVWVFFDFHFFKTVFIINKILSSCRYQRAQNFSTCLNLITNRHLLLKLNPLLLHLRLLLLFSLINQFRFPQIELLQLILTFKKLILVVEVVSILQLACFLQPEQLVGVSGLTKCEIL
jgi:hypothetical protein